MTRYEHTRIGYPLIWFPAATSVLFAIGATFELRLGNSSTPYGWLYNVAGWDAVAITLQVGRKFALGTVTHRVSQMPFGIALASNAE